MTPEIVASLALVVLWAIRAIFKERAVRAENNFSLGVTVAYQIVNEIALRTGNKYDDKAALALRYLRDFLSTRGQELTVVDEQRAKLLFTAMHGESLKQEKARVR